MSNIFDTKGFQLLAAAQIAALALPSPCASARLPVKFFHGGVPGLRVGHMVLPASVTGTTTVSDYGAWHVHHKERVYVTTKYETALIFAITHASGTGCVYECKPFGKLEVDLDITPPGVSFHCERARVVKVLRVDAELRQHVQTQVARYVSRVWAQSCTSTEALRARGMV